MPRQWLVATKPMTYGTRRLEAGDRFEVPNRQHATIWTLVRKTARPDYDVAVVAQAAPPEPGSLDALRADALALGIRVDRRWGEERLRRQIAEASGPETMLHNELALPEPMPAPDPEPVPVPVPVPEPEPQPEPEPVVPEEAKAPEPEIPQPDYSPMTTRNSGAVVNVGSTAYPIFRRQ